MMNMIAYFFGSVFVIYFMIYCWHNLEDKKINYKDYKLYIIILILSFVSTLLTYFTQSTIKVISIILVLLIVNYLFFSKNIKKAILTLITSELITFIAELLFVLLMLGIFKQKLDVFLKTPLFSFVSNVFMALISFIILRTRIPQKTYTLTLKSSNSLRNHQLIEYSILLMTFMIALTAISYFKLSTVYTFLFNACITIIYIIIIYKIASTRNQLERISSKYSMSVDSLKEAEDIANKYRISSHENKNQLLIIKNMLSKDKKAIKYIETLINEKEKDNERLIRQTYKIPNGGLRATIYSKLNQMEKEKIKYNLIISKEVSTVDLIELDEELVLSICQIISVFLDNAIEAVQYCKNKKISIEIYLDENNKLCINITNKFAGCLNVTKMGEKKFSSKGPMRGYGLQLVKTLLTRNNELENSRYICKDQFTQILKIKM